MGLTRLSHTNSDVPSHEARVRESKRLLQAVKRSELYIAETLRLAIQLVLDYPDRSDLTAIQEAFYVGLCHVERQVAQMRGIWWLVREWECFTSGVSSEAVLDMLAFSPSRSLRYVRHTLATEPTTTRRWSTHAAGRALPGWSAECLASAGVTTTVVATAAVSRRSRRERHGVHLVGP